MIMMGKLLFMRTGLTRSISANDERLKELIGKKIAFPFNEAFGLDTLPFKIIV